MSDSHVSEVLNGRPLHVLAVGKAAAAMAAAFAGIPHLSVVRTLAIGTHTHDDLPDDVEWMESSHPYPDARSEAAGLRALALAEGVHSGEAMVILLSGGASALMAAPMEGLTLADKIETTRRMMTAGADIHALNTVRRHLSRVKGGRLAAACVGTTITLAISDVVGDDLHAIGSGPGVPDDSTWSDAAAALERFGGDAHAETVKAVMRRGMAGELADTPKTGHPALARSVAKVIGSRLDAMAGAAEEARRLGYDTIVLDEPVTGEARDVAPLWRAQARDRIGQRRHVCLISSGETTVRVNGSGRGGRNLEFALSLAGPLATWGHGAACSIGTDGIDGSSGVAGGMVDTSSLARARAAGLPPPEHVLAANDSLAFFAPLGDTVRLGRTDTNVGDVQVLLID